MDGRQTTRGRLRRSATWALAFVLAGVVGVGLCWWRRRRRGRRENRTTTFGRATVALFASLLVLGALFRTFVAMRGVRPCVTDQSAGRYDAAPPLLVNTEKAVMWPVTGLGMAYAELRGRHSCLVAAEGLYYAHHNDSFFFGGRSFTLGDIFLSRNRADEAEPQRLALYYHERHHRRQWTIASVIGGPLAFPIAYTVDDIFFPYDRNHFEQEAGTERGGYDPAHQSGPKLGLPEVGVLIGAAGAAELIFVWRRRRRARLDQAT